MIVAPPDSIAHHEKERRVADAFRAKQAKSNIASEGAW